jgi:ketosteroid isomerase-like protein
MVRSRNSQRKEPDLATQRKVVDAFLAASRDGDIDALVALLDPDVVLRPVRAPQHAVVERGGHRERIQVADMVRRDDERTSIRQVLQAFHSNGET